VPEAIYQPFPIPSKVRAYLWRHAPATRRPRHFHAEPELNLVTAGNATFGVGEKTLQVSAGDLLAWRPGQDHELLDASPEFDLFVIGVTPEFSSRVLEDTREAAWAGPISARLQPAPLAELAAACASPLSAMDVSAIERTVGDLWHRAHALRRSSAGLHSLTRRAMVSLYQEPTLARSDVAVGLRAYPTEVSRYFHRDTGLTFSGFRARLRLLGFIQAVDAGAPSLLAAALGAGFGSYSQCHRVFQQTFGCTPRAFFATPLRSQMQNAFAPWEAAASERAVTGPRAKRCGR
jgi:AraC-like DNA-binding protein